MSRKGRGICLCCGERGQRNKGKDKNGSAIYDNLCYNCHTIKYNQKGLGYKKHKKEICELCGFKAINKCQLDVDHIDGNKSNNNPDNLQTLCSNCHRLKTWLNKDWEMKALNN